MLKIKNNISPQKLKKKLLKLGFIESWNYIGMIKLDKSFRILNPSVSIKDSCIKINTYSGLFDEAREQKQNDFIADTLFDLIQAGLIEKGKSE